MEFTLSIPYITTDVNTATTANKNNKKTPSKKWRQLKYSQSLCWQDVELASSSPLLPQDLENDSPNIHKCII